MNKEIFYKIIKNQTPFSEETNQELERLTNKYPYFQSASILYLKSLKTTNNHLYKDTLKQIAPMIPDRKQLYKTLNLRSPIKSQKNFSNQVDQFSPDYFIGNNTKNLSSGNNLIDKFLSSRPEPIKIEKSSEQTTEETSENEITAKSATENDELITETLAMIYVEQKKYDKAQHAFKKLSLKYPEKNIYFASRIKEIEKLKNI